MEGRKEGKKAEMQNKEGKIWKRKEVKERRARIGE